MPQYQYITGARYHTGLRIPKRTRRRLIRMQRRFIRRAKLLAHAFVTLLCLLVACFGITFTLMAMLICWS